SRSGAIPERVRTDPPITFTMFAASLCAGMTRVRGPSSMGTGYENATRSVMKAAPNEKTMRLTNARRLQWGTLDVLPLVLALIAAGAVPIFWWARRQLGVLPAIVFEIAYLAFWGVLSAVVYDFHHIAFAVPAVSFGLYAVLTKNNRLLWAMVALGLLTRENIALTFAAIGVFVILAQRRWRLGAALIAVCAAWFVSVIEVIMPAIAGAPYGHWTYQDLGPGPGSALLHV